MTSPADWNVTCQPRSITWVPILISFSRMLNPAPKLRMTDAPTAKAYHNLGCAREDERLKPR